MSDFNPPSTHDVGGIDHPDSCTCELEDDGDVENGPHLAITYDESCPRHGRVAEPNLWRDPFAPECDCGACADREAMHTEPSLLSAGFSGIDSDGHPFV